MNTGDYFRKQKIIEAGKKGLRSSEAVEWLTGYGYNMTIKAYLRARERMLSNRHITKFEIQKETFFKCRKCGSVFENEKTANTHELTHHYIIEKKHQSLTKNQIDDCKIKCTICKKPFTTKKERTEHINQYHRL